MSVLTVYTKPACVQCNMTMTELDKRGIPYETQDLTENPEMLERFKAQGLLSAPIVVPVDGDPWAGFIPDKIKSLVID